MSDMIIFMSHPGINEKEDSKLKKTNKQIK